MERNVLEYVDHLHEHFLYPCSINERGRYNVPNNPIEGYRLRYVLAHRECRTHYTFLVIASRCMGQASQSMSGRMGHTGQKQRQRQNDLRGSVRVEEVLVVRKAGNYVTYIAAHVLYVHMQSTNRPRESSSRGSGGPERNRSLKQRCFVAVGPGPVISGHFAPALHVQQKEMRVTCRRLYTSAGRAVSYTQFS